MSERPLYSEAAFRNLPPLIEQLESRLPERGLMLELASGGGQHAAAFARAFGRLDWLPSEADPRMRASIEAWRAREGLANYLAPLDLDMAKPRWWEAVEAVPAAAIAINLTHITPWVVTATMLAGLGAILPAGGRFYLYGPFFEAEKPIAPTNRSFDHSLRKEEPAWGLRSAEVIDEEADRQGLVPEERLAMPSNNLLLIYRCRA